MPVLLVLTPWLAGLVALVLTTAAVEVLPALVIITSNKEKTL